MKQQELLRGQLSVNEKENSEVYSTEGTKMVEVEKIEGTPFSIVTLNDKEGAFEDGADSFIAAGNSRLTEMMSAGKAKMMIQDRSWDLIVQMQVFLLSKRKEIEKDMDIPSPNLDRMIESSLQNDESETM